MRAAGIETTLGTYAMHAHPAFARLYLAGDLPNAARAQRQSLTLPVVPRMPESDVDRVVVALGEILGRPPVDDRPSERSRSRGRGRGRGSSTICDAAYLTRDLELVERWDRSLSFDDAMFDRWERAARLGFGDGAEHLQQRDGARLGERRSPHVDRAEHGARRLGREGLRIGSWCSISAGVHLYTHDTVLWSLSMGGLERATDPVSIGDGSYLGAQSVVVAGVSIGSRCVVGANSFVNADVPSRTVVGGVPARRIGRVEGDGTDVRVVMDASSEAAVRRPGP